MQRRAQFRLAHARKLFRLAHDRTRHVEGDIAAADDDDFAAERHAVPKVDVQQEINRPQHAVELHALDGQLAAFVRADAQEHRFVALLLEVREGEFAAEPGVQADLHAERLDRRDFRLDDFARQPVFGHAEHQHPARQVLRLEDRRRKAHQRQFVRARHAGRPGADDRHFATAADALAPRIAQFGIDAAEIEIVRLDAEFFTDEPLQRADGNGRVERSAPAFCLARRGAHAAADGGKGIRRAGDDVGVLVTALGDGLHVAAGIRANRAALAAEHLPGEITHVGQFDWIGCGHLSKSSPVRAGLLLVVLVVDFLDLGFRPRPSPQVMPWPVSRPPSPSCGRWSRRPGNRRSSCRRRLLMPEPGLFIIRLM